MHYPHVATLYFDVRTFFVEQERGYFRYSSPVPAAKLDVPSSRLRPSPTNAPATRNQGAASSASAGASPGSAPLTSGNRPPFARGERRYPQRTSAGGPL